MINIIEAMKPYFLSCLLTTIIVIYIVSKIMNENINFKNKKVYVIYTLLVFCTLINCVVSENFIKFFISTIYTIVFMLVLFKNDIGKTTVAVILEQIILFVSELIYMLMIILVLQFDGTSLFETFQGTLLTNLLVCIIAVMLINFKIIKKLCNHLMNYMNKIKQKNKDILAFILIITLNVLITIIYVNSQNISMVIINVIFIIIYSYIIYLFLNEKNQNIIVKEENKNLIDNLHEYEKMLDYQRVSNHENKNQLLVIKSMINKNNKRLQNYIDEVIKEKREDNETLYTKAKRIPSGGLQGLIYQKMLQMQDKNINIDLNVSTEVRKVDFSKMNARTNYDICRSIGIIIDNAVDETLKVKDKEISISMYKDDNEFVIEIANKCKDLPDLDKIDNKGYTTKEKGHGYGLSLLKEICDANKDIINERKIVGNIFLQIIKIKM